MAKSNGGKSAEKPHPVHTIRMFTGAAVVEAAIWLQDDRYNVTLTRTYKERDSEEYKSSKGFWPQDLPHAALALNAAALWIEGQRDQSF